MGLPLAIALHRSKSTSAVKTTNSSAVVKADQHKVTVVYNRLQNHYLVLENNKLVGNSSLVDIGNKYGNSGWEVGK